MAGVYGQVSTARFASLSRACELFLHAPEVRSLEPKGLATGTRQRSSGLEDQLDDGIDPGDFGEHFL